jgi:hypothetical protein
MIKVSKSLIKPLAASGLTSILMLVDRVVMNFIPLIFWGVELAAYWIFLRAWLFLLMSFEGGVGGKTANQIAKIKANTSTSDLISTLVKKRLFRQIYWGLTVFIVNAIVVWAVFFYQPFEFKNTEVSTFILIGIYAACYYVTQLVVYCQRGIGQIYQGQMFANAVKLLEITALVILPIVGMGILECVLSITIIRGLAGCFGLSILFHKIANTQAKNTVIPKEDETVKTKAQKSLTLGFVLYPLFPALNNFLPIFFLSSVLSPILIMQFSISRLFGRALLQLSQILSRVLWPYLRLKNDALDFINSFKKIMSSYIIISGLAFLLIISISFLVDGVEFKEVKLDSTLLIIYSFLAFTMGLIEVFLSMLIAKEKHAIILITRITLCLSVPFYVWVANTNTSLELLGIIMILAELITLTMCYLAWLQIIKESGGSQLHDET